MQKGRKKEFEDTPESGGKNRFPLWQVKRHMATGENRTFMKVVAECLLGKRCAATPVRSKTTSEIMTSPAVTVGEDTLIMEIAYILMEKNINRLPVVNEDGKLNGIVSRQDLVKSITIPG